jgi:integrase
MQEKQAIGTDRALADDTIKRCLSLVSAVFTAAVEDEIIESNPCSGVHLKKRAGTGSTREKWSVLTLEEQKLIAGCHAIPFADRLAIRFAIATGLRQGEQFALRLTDLHTGPNEPHVVVRFGGARDLPPKSGKIRRVPLFGDGLVAARQWTYELGTYAPSNPLGLVFPTPTGTRRSVGKPLGRGDTFRRYLALVGVTRRVRWHDLRHTFGSSLVSGMWGRAWSLEEIRPVIGHSSIAMTQRYAHVCQTRLAEAARETSFAAPTLPFVASANDNDRIVPAANDTSPDLSMWWDEAVSS